MEIVAKITVQGGFGWEGPGNPDHLPLKAKQLLGLLVTTPARRGERRFFEATLWPSVPFENRQASLRQLLVSIRKHVGEVLLSDRHSIWLNPAFPLSCDFWEKSFPFPKWLPPVISEEQLKRLEAPCASLGELIEWHASRHPRRAIDLLETEFDLATGIESDKLTMLLRQLDRSHGEAPPSPWLHVYWAWNTGERDADFTGRQLKRALLAATDDPVLRARATYLLCSHLIMRGEAKRAEAISHRVAATLGPGHDPLRGYLLSVLGTARIHEGFFVEGALDNASALPLFDSLPVEAAVHTGLQAVYLATSGRTDEAHRFLQLAQRDTEKLDHVRLEALCRMTRLSLAHQSFDQGAAEKEADALVAMDHASFTLYGLEAQTLNAWRKGDRPAAKERWSRVVRIRKSAKMPLTKWDQTRLLELAPRLRATEG
jgi:hypothetical protein